MVERWKDFAIDRALQWHRWHRRLFRVEGYDAQRPVAVAAGLHLQIELKYSVTDTEG